jgi:hypothetical protein
VVGEGAGPSRHANLAFSGVYKTPPHATHRFTESYYRVELHT